MTPPIQFKSWPPSQDSLVPHLLRQLGHVLPEIAQFSIQDLVPLVYCSIDVGLLQLLQDASNAGSVFHMFPALLIFLPGPHGREVSLKPHRLGVLFNGLQLVVVFKHVVGVHPMCHKIRASPPGT